MTDDEILVSFRSTFPVGPHLFTADATKFARAILAAHTAKLLAGVEMPEYKYIDRHDVPKEGMCVYTQDQLQQYAAQARMKALSEAKAVCVASELIDLPTTVEIAAVRKCAAAIESLKGKQA